jgi:hypothetical protein
MDLPAAAAVAAAVPADTENPGKKKNPFRNQNRERKETPLAAHGPRRLPVLVLAVDLSDHSFFTTAVAVLVRIPPTSSATNRYQ